MSKKPENEGITAISVCGFKSIHEWQRMEIRPLTLLAGANSSGKSIMMQPLLLMKQTLESSYEPAGALRLDGDNVYFTDVEQFLSKVSGHERNTGFSIKFEYESKMVDKLNLTLNFKKNPDKDLDIEDMRHSVNNQLEQQIKLGMGHSEILNLLSVDFANFLGKKYELQIARQRCFLNITVRHKQTNRILDCPLISPDFTKDYLQSFIHLPGLRGEPKRVYKTTAIEPPFVGTFEVYTAGIIANWQATNHINLKLLGKYLQDLGLTGKITAKKLNSTQIELQVGRLSNSRNSEPEDMVNIADVGFGVSQVLPVLVALLVAKKGQIVYLEQPEIHLHPRAQSKLAKILADTAKRGVKVIVETHSSLLLLGIQTLVAQGKLPPNLVKLHWFERNRKTGATTIDSRDLDEQGAFGDWAADFGDVTLKANRDYLDAVEKQGQYS